MSVKFGAIADIHFGSANRREEMWGGEWRTILNAATRFAAFVTTVNAASVDFNVQLGDILDSNAVYATSEAAFQAEADNLTDAPNDFYNVIGNHKTWSQNPTTTRDDYFTLITGYQGTQANAWNPDADTNNNTWGYTFEVNSVRFVVLCNEIIINLQTDEGSQLDWLENTALDTALPVVIFAHANPYTVGGTVIADSNLVQAVIFGHDHRETFTMNGDVPYFNLGGSVRNLISITDTSMNVYYIFEVDPNKIHGTSQWKASINVTGYGWGSNYDMTKWSFGI